MQPSDLRCVQPELIVLSEVDKLAMGVSAKCSNKSNALDYTKPSLFGWRKMECFHGTNGRMNGTKPFSSD